AGRGAARAVPGRGTADRSCRAARGARGLPRRRAGGRHRALRHRGRPAAGRDRGGHLAVAGALLTGGRQVTSSRRCLASPGALWSTGLGFVSIGLGEVSMALGEVSIGLGASGSQLSQPSAARCRARRRSLRRVIWIASSNSSTRAIANAIIEIGSWPGVATAANTNRPKVSPRRHALSLARSEEHTSELQSRENLVCRLLLEKKKYTINA